MTINEDNVSVFISVSFLWSYLPSKSKWSAKSAFERDIYSTVFPHMFCRPHWRCWSRWCQRAAQSSSPLKSKSSLILSSVIFEDSNHMETSEQQLSSWADPTAHHWCSHSRLPSGSPPYWREPEGRDKSTWPTPELLDSPSVTDIVTTLGNNVTLMTKIDHLSRLTCLAWAVTPPSTSWPEATSIPSWPEMYIVLSTTTAWLKMRERERERHTTRTHTHTHTHSHITIKNSEHNLPQNVLLKEYY